MGKKYLGPILESELKNYVEKLNNKERSEYNDRVNNTKREYDNAVKNYNAVDRTNKQTLLDSVETLLIAHERYYKALCPTSGIESFIRNDMDDKIKEKKQLEKELKIVVLEEEPDNSEQERGPRRPRP